MDKNIKQRNTKTEKRCKGGTRWPPEVENYSSGTDVSKRYYFLQCNDTEEMLYLRIQVT